MKFQSSVDLNLPPDRAAALYNNPSYYKEWQDGFVSYTQLSGEPRTVGAKAKVLFAHGKRRMELLETIQVMNLPVEINALYEHEHMVNTMIVRFSALPGQRTRITTGIGYVRFVGIIPKIMSLLMSGMYKKQNQKWLDRFKQFAESLPATSKP
ncbi:MAG TPA: SRPBCC family protein [Puia sp.]|jgi:hypothetical protein|nr:SRPBCC family protein [Puia sp.]